MPIICLHIGYYHFIIWQYTFIKLFVFFLFLRWCIENRIFYFLSLLRRLTFNIIRLLPPLTLLDPLKPFDKWEGQIIPCEIHTLAKGKGRSDWKLDYTYANWCLMQKNWVICRMLFFFLTSMHKKLGHESIPREVHFHLYITFNPSLTKEGKWKT